ncbi:hypothetical protein ACVI1K_008239 [Bradyrhizobium sp. USDA 4508]
MTLQPSRASAARDSSLADPAERSERRLGKDRVVGQGQQSLEYLGISHIAVEHRRNAARTRLAKQRRSTLHPARIRQHRGCASDGFKRKPIGRFRKETTEVHDLPLARTVDDDPRDR